MRGDKLSIFTRGQFDSIESRPDITSLASLGWFESSVATESYEEYSALPNSFFREESSSYDRESRLFSLLYTEAINMHGVPMVYYVNSYDTTYDKIFGEDNNRNILRNFNVQAYYELPNEDELWSRFNIEGIDNFHIQITMRHFDEASRYNSQGTSRTYTPYLPKEGDFLKAKYNDYFYEVVTVKQQVGQFLKRHHVWDLIVRPMRDENLSVSATIPSTDYIRSVQAIDDIFNVSASVAREKPRDLYQPGTTESSPDPLFGSW